MNRFRNNIQASGKIRSDMFIMRFDDFDNPEVIGSCIVLNIMNIG